jgi:hypothetical protein
MCDMKWQINVDYFRKLAREYYGERRHIGIDEFVVFLDVWAAENHCKRVGVGNMRCSKEDFLMLKLKGDAVCFLYSTV